MKQKEYLGDSVYAEIDNSNRIILTTENGLQTSNIIILEPEILENLLRFKGLKTYET